MQNSASALLNRLLARGKFRHVQVLLKLAELGSLQRTAESIGMTQSSVTQTLAYLERLLETQLFERHSRGDRPTRSDQDLFPVAPMLLLGFAQGAEVVAARQQRGLGTVRVVASVGAINGVLVDLLPRFGELHPAITVHLVEGEGDEQLRAISRHEVDLVACRRPPVIPEGWQFTPLRDDRFAVLCHMDHPLAGRKALAWSQLSEETWLLAPAGSAAREHFDTLATGFVTAPRTSPIVTRSPSMLWWLLRHESLLALLPVNFGRPLIEAREVCELDVRPAHLLEPLGLLQPVEGRQMATELLVRFLVEAAAASAPGQQTARSAAKASALAAAISERQRRNIGIKALPAARLP